MTKGKMRTVVMALMLAFGMGTGNMAVALPLLSVGDAVFGADSITRDPNTGLDWLDLTLSNGRSFNDISTRFGVGGEFEGFRHALGGEVSQFFTDAGIPILGVGFHAANAAPVLELLALWGLLSDDGIRKTSFAFTADIFVIPPQVDPFHVAAALNWTSEFLTPRALASTFGFATSDVESRSEEVGHALVRPSLTTTIIPEPATSVLLLSGLVMGGLAKRKRTREKRRSSRL